MLWKGVGFPATTSEKVMIFEPPLSRIFPPHVLIWVLQCTLFFLSIQRLFHTYAVYGFK